MGVMSINDVDSSQKVWVGNLPFETTADQLHGHFCQLGEPTHAEIVRKGIGCVAYATAEEAETAISAFSGSELNGQTIQTDSWEAKLPSLGKGKGGGSKGGAGYGAAKGGGGGNGGGWGSGGGGGWDGGGKGWGDKGGGAAAKGGGKATFGFGWGAGPAAHTAWGPPPADAWGPPSPEWGPPPGAAAGFAGWGPQAVGAGMWGKGAGKAVVTPMAAVPAGPTVWWIAVPEDSQMPTRGFPADALAIAYEKGIGVFGSASHIISELVTDVATEVAIEHDADWVQFPEVGEALKVASGEEHCFAVASCPGKGKWAVGVASGWKTRESSAKLALALALVVDDAELLAKVAKNYTDFAAFCHSQGLQPAAPAPAAPVFEAAPAAAAVATPGGGGAPPIYFLTLTQEAQLVERGLANEGPAIAHSKEWKEYFCNAHSILSEFVADVSTEVVFQDDPDWKVMPEVAAALKEASGEENCYCVAICAEKGCWGVGVASGWKARESSAKLALALCLAQATGRLEELAQSANYPEFGRLCASAGLVSPQPKKRRRGNW